MKKIYSIHRREKIGTKLLFFKWISYTDAGVFQLAGAVSAGISAHENLFRPGPGALSPSSSTNISAALIQYHTLEFHHQQHG